MKKSTIKVKINSNGEITRVIGNVGQWTFNAKMDEASRIARSTDTPAAEVPFIGLLEEHV